MNILIVSQCKKNALKETRRIVDQFAERCGERTWQTPITMAGLDTLRRMLKKTARKNTAVACHWIRGKNNSELLWVVGNAGKFNIHGAVPTNTTKSDILRKNDENDWHSAEAIRLLAAFAALFHDFGKANYAFQKKLKSSQPVADALRHEWVSLRLFQAFVGDDSDSEWLLRLTNISKKLELDWLQKLICDDVENRTSPFKKMPPLASLIGWLIVTHHRMPTQMQKNIDNIPNVPNTRELLRLPKGINVTWCGAKLSLDGLEGSDLKEKKQQIKNCWVFKNGHPVNSEAWQKRVAKHSRKILENKTLLDKEWLKTFDPYVLHMSRLVLMLADHHYSSLSDPKRRVTGDSGFPLVANTNRLTGEPNQNLDEHLIGVEIETGRIVYQLPSLAKNLPRIARHKGFKRRSKDPRFRWQDKAYDLAVSLRGNSSSQGFFGVNMASTGFGKTLANGRIMYALADPIIGARFSIALGLRTLTLQTGEAYRKRLGLGSDDLAVLVGGSQVRELFQHGLNREKNRMTHGEKSGSESFEPLFDEDSFVHYEGSLDDGLIGEWMVNTRGARELLSAPVLSCTIDHLMGATEGLRGGRQIAPMLRLMTSDLVLDEPDDFGLEDLPALTRLVHWAGLLGSRVLLSSATLPPSIVVGLFDAYLKGREYFQKNRGQPGQVLEVCTAWFDEFGCDSGTHSDDLTFDIQHRKWTEKRTKLLDKNTDRRRMAKIIPMEGSSGTSELGPICNLAHTLVPNIVELHNQHHSVDPKSDKRVSFGLIRMANIYPLVELTQQLAQLDLPSNYQVHLICYHSMHPLLVRSQIERQLDHLLDRHQVDMVFEIPELRTVLQKSKDMNHLVVVMATAVAEVGRDHDYDWAIVEPSSMRSIIQLAGRVKRHRPGSVKTPNLLLLDKNIKSLNGEIPAFTKPGFESKGFLLSTHKLSELLTEKQLGQIDSRPRIIERPEADPEKNLVDLEHDHLRAVMVNDDKNRKLSVKNWWETNAHLSGELQRYQRFRYDPTGRERFILLYDQDEDRVCFVRVEKDGSLTPSENLCHPVTMPIRKGSNVSFWGSDDYSEMVKALAAELDMDQEMCSQKFGILDLPARGAERGWDYHPVLGFRHHK